MKEEAEGCGLTSVDYSNQKALPLPELDSVDCDTLFMRFFPRRASKIVFILTTICRKPQRNQEDARSSIHRESKL